MHMCAGVGRGHSRLRVRRRPYTRLRADPTHCAAPLARHRTRPNTVAAAGRRQRRWANLCGEGRSCSASGKRAGGGRRAEGGDGLWADPAVTGVLFRLLRSMQGEIGSSRGGGGLSCRGSSASLSAVPRGTVLLYCLCRGAPAGPCAHSCHAAHLGGRPGRGSEGGE